MQSCGIVGHKLTAILFDKTFPAGLALASLPLIVGNLFIYLFCCFNFNVIKGAATRARPLDFFECTLLPAVELPSGLAPGARRGGHNGQADARLAARVVFR